MKAVACGSSSHLSSPTSGMRHHHLRVFLEVRRNHDDGQILVDRVEREQEVAAHVEIELSGGQEKAVVRLRAALDNGHVEAVFLVGSIDQRLVISAVLGLGEPIGAERDFVGRVRHCRKGQTGQEDGDCSFHQVVLQISDRPDSCNLGATGAEPVEMRPPKM